MVPFGGWDMPLAYPTGTLAEHRACRTAPSRSTSATSARCASPAPAPSTALQRALTNDLDKIGPGRAQYTHLLDDDDASVLDDIIVWWVDDERFDVMPNASNTDRVVDALGEGARRRHRASGPSSPLQGPHAARLPRIRRARGRRHRPLPRRAASPWHGDRCLVAGTGLHRRGRRRDRGARRARRRRCGTRCSAAGFEPAGLGARDTLRLEAGLPLHGHELGPGITPLQAGLGWVVSWDKGEFRGRTPLGGRTGARRAPAGSAASSIEGRRPPRAEQAVLVDGDAGRRGHERQLLTGARPRHRAGLRPARRRRSATTSASMPAARTRRHGREAAVRGRNPELSHVG